MGSGAEVAQFAASPAADLAAGGVPSAGADGSLVPSDPSLIRPWYCSGSFACSALCFPNDYCELVCWAHFASDGCGPHHVLPGFAALDLLSWLD